MVSFKNAAFLITYKAATIIVDSRVNNSIYELNKNNLPKQQHSNAKYPIQLHFLWKINTPSFRIIIPNPVAMPATKQFKFAHNYSTIES